MQDGSKHECIKILLAEHPLQAQYGIKASLEKQLEKYQQHFTQWSNIKIKVVTWNCAGNAPSESLNIGDVLLPTREAATVPDVLVVGL